jgi:hypothetical protein
MCWSRPRLASVVGAIPVPCPDMCLGQSISDDPNGIRLVRKPAPLLHLQHSRKTRPPVRMVSAEITYQQEAMDGCFDIPRAGSTGSAGAFFL